MNSNEIIAWSLAAATVAFVVLCMFLISLLKTAQRSLASARSAVDEVKETIEGLQGEVKKLAETINEVTADVKGKLKATNPLFDAVQDVGLMLKDMTGTARVASQNLTHAVRSRAAAIDTADAPTKWIHRIALGVRVMSGIRKGWKEHRTAEPGQEPFQPGRQPDIRGDELEQLRY